MRDPAHLDDVPDYAKVVSLPAENRLGISLLFFFLKKGGNARSMWDYLVAFIHLYSLIAMSSTKRTKGVRTGR